MLSLHIHAYTLLRILMCVQVPSISICECASEVCRSVYESIHIRAGAQYQYSKCKLLLYLRSRLRKVTREQHLLCETIV